MPSFAAGVFEADVVREVSDVRLCVPYSCAGVNRG